VYTKCGAIIHPDFGHKGTVSGAVPVLWKYSAVHVFTAGDYTSYT